MRSLLSAIRRRLRNTFYASYGMRGTAPINPAFGTAEGTPIDRHFIHAFLESNCGLITGDVLEVGDRSYTRRFGVDVSTSDVLSAVESAGVTFVADLESCPEIADESYDALVFTQVLHCIYDMEAVVAEAFRILKPGGSVLCTVPGISQVSRYDMDRWGDRWRLTSQSAEELFRKAFAHDGIRIATYGNAFTAVCFLQGVPAERLPARKLDRWEPDFQLIIGIVATKGPDNKVKV